MTTPDANGLDLGQFEGHTPGPWEWDAGLCPPDGPEKYADIYVGDCEPLIANFNNCIPEGIANARLIAAAPRLLDELRATRARLEELEARYQLAYETIDRTRHHVFFFRERLNTAHKTIDAISSDCKVFVEKIWQPLPTPPEKQG